MHIQLAGEIWLICDDALSKSVARGMNPRIQLSVTLPQCVSIIIISEFLQAQPARARARTQGKHVR